MTKKTALLAAGLIAFSGALHAVPHVPVLNTSGFTSIALTPGYNPVSISLVNAAMATSSVVTPNGITGTTVVRIAGGNPNFTTPTNMGAALDANKLYYLEVVKTAVGSPDCLGARFELNVAATKTSANGTVTIDLASPTNTAAALPDLSGCSVVIREHVTVFQVFGGQGNALLQSATGPENADHILFFDPATKAYRTYWLRNNSGTLQWRSLSFTDTADYSGLPIRPGEGLFVYRQTSPGAVTLRHYGMVRTTPFRWALPAGPSLVSHGAPADRTPTTSDMVTVKGWKGAGASGGADHFQIWGGSSFQAYWLRANASGSTQQWRSITPADTTDYMNSNLIHGDKAMFINSRQRAQRLVDLQN